MASFPPSDYMPCYKVQNLSSAVSAARRAQSCQAKTLPSAISTVSTATGCSSCTGSTLGSEEGTRCPEDAGAYYAKYAAWQAAATNERDSLLACAKLAVSSDDSVSVQNQPIVSSDDSISIPKKVGPPPPKPGAKPAEAGGSRRHWILPPKQEPRQPKGAAVAPSPKRPDACCSSTKNTPQSNAFTRPDPLSSSMKSSAFTRHWMLAPRKAQEQDQTSEVSTESKADASSDSPSRAGNSEKRETSSIEEEACLGTWCYPSSSYKVSRATVGALCFEHTLPSGRTIMGQLQPCGEYLEGEVFADNSQCVGTIRLRPGVDSRTLVSNFRHAGGEELEGLAALAAGKADWGPDVTAKKEDGESSRRPQQPEAVPARERLSLPGKLFSWRDCVPGASPRACSTAVDVPVKHTFIQFDEPQEVRLPRSSPAVLTSGPFMLQTNKKEETEFDEAKLLAQPVAPQAHVVGECRPCAYFWGKQDGCRSGDTCKFCHLCQPGELKRRRREKDRFLRQKQRAQRGSNTSTASTPST